MSNWFTEELVEKGEVPFEEIEEMADSGKFHEWNFEAFDYQESGYEDVVDELKKFKAVDYLTLDEKRKNAEEAGNIVEAEGYRQQMEKMVDNVLKIYRSKNIFPIQYFSELGVMDEIEKCIAYKAKFDGNTVSCVPGNTMFFNGTRWKAISEYKEGDKVLQYNADGTASLVDPIKYIHYKSKEPFYYSGGIGITKNHNVVWLDGDKLVLNPLEKLLIDDSISDVVIPCGAVYNNKDVAGVYKSTLTHTFWAVSQNDKSSMTDYTVSLYDGRVSLSKNCLGLCLKDRIALLNMFGLNENTMRMTQQSGFSHLFQYPADTVKVLYDLCSLSFNSLNFYYDNGKAHRTYYSNTFELLEVTEDAMEKVYKEDKYCFTVPSHMLVLKSSEGKVFVTGNCGAGIGTGLCRWLFPNLFDTPSAHDLTKKDAETQYKKFLNDEYLRRAIKFCYSYKDGCPTPTSVEGGLRLVGSAPSNFRPMNAKAVYERFCPKGGTIYDFCSGFGGRMLGALSSKNNYKYVGTDPCTETMYHLHQLGDYIEMVTGREDSYELHCLGSEDFRGPANSIDFAFSSPPYFNLEVYSDEPTQCYNKFPKLEDWLEGYVRETIKNIYHMLKPGHFYAVNIADFKVGGGGEVAYVDEWKRISAEEGMPLFDTVYLGVTARAGSAEQAAGELKKENIMIFKKPL